MEILELKATAEFIDVRRGGAVIYDTDVTTAGPGIILMDNPEGEYHVTLLSNFHPGGRVKVAMRGVGQSANKKYEVGQVVAKLVLL